jgi:16S rRNA (cytosine1402-N4)-methyltransferase
MTKAISEIHEPVLLQRCLDILGDAIEGKPAVMIDGTLGLAGHSEAFLEKFPQLTLIGIDRDPSALALAGKRLERFGDRVHLVHAVYNQIAEVLEDLDIDGVDAILLDLGVSSMQLDEADRGFAYSYDAPLDMRMDATVGETAADVVNTYSEKELARIFKEYGEERYAKSVAREIAVARKTKPFVTSSKATSGCSYYCPIKPANKPRHDYLSMR